MNKKLYLILLLVVTYLSSSAQYSEEYRYFSVSGGITHGLFNTQQLGETSKLLLIDKTYEQLINMDIIQFHYGIGYNFGLYYNIDSKNDNIGATVGAQYQLNSYKTDYFVELYEYEILETNKISSISLPLYFKYGKNYYERMRYLFLGVQANFYITGKSNYEYINGTANYKLSKNMLSDISPGFFIGFNYLKMNLKVEYTPGSIIKKSPILAGNLSDINGHSDNFISLQTNINIPLNSWNTFRTPNRLLFWIMKTF